jgi:hypothetical protein
MWPACPALTHQWDAPYEREFFLRVKKIPTGRYKWSAFALSANKPKRASRIRGFKAEVTCKIGTRGIAKEK